MVLGHRKKEWILAIALLATVFSLACKRKTPPQFNDPPKTSRLECLIPIPVSIAPSQGVFHLNANTAIYVDANSERSKQAEPPFMAEAKNVGQYLAQQLTPATGFSLQVQPVPPKPAPGSILLKLVPDASFSDEGYRLAVTSDHVILSASKPAGLFYGVQTLRQLLPPSIEQATPQPGPWEIPACTIEDHPRFAWRGAMLDVARHFFSVADVKRFIDLMARYKLNRFHIHLSDDQGWRLFIASRPKLTACAGNIQVGRGPGGFYTQADYSEIVAYAQSRCILVIPEIDVPGHSSAALTAYPELSRNTFALGNQENTFAFLDDVIRELSALTPGPYIHIGGDETLAVRENDYKVFVTRVQDIVQSHGKQMIGWEEVVRIDHLSPQALIQHWRQEDDLPRKAAQAGTKMILSPAAKAYLDMKYAPSTLLGQDWSAYIEVQDGYDWDPGIFILGIQESQILGVESPLWTETVQTMRDVEYMAFPRLIGLAEVGWSPMARRQWRDYRLRLAAHGPRLTHQGVNFYRSPQVPWQ